MKVGIERHNRSKDDLNHLLNVLVSRILPQAIIKQVLELFRDQENCVRTILL